MRNALLPLACLLFVACTSSTGERPEPAPRPAPEAPAGPSASPVSSGSAAPGKPGGAGPGATCATDADCAPAECCHASSCGSAAQKPDCRAVLCSMECRPNTFDCGGGGCLCRGGRCQADLHEPR